MAKAAKKQEARETLRREFSFERAALNAEARTVDLCFASETPVERYFGPEILAIEEKAVRLDRLNKRAPLLLNHDTDKQIGVIEKAWIDADKKARATVRFSKSALGEEIFQDVSDGIRSLVSVGYQIHKMVTEKQSGGTESQRATDWEPLEISIVSIPADTSAGVGRSIPESVQPPAEEEIQKTEIRIMETPVIDSKDVLAKERARVADLNAIASQHKGAGAEVHLSRAVAEGLTASDFSSLVLRECYKAQAVKPSDADIGMSQKEIRQFSIQKAIADIAFGRGLSGIEKEATEAAAKLFKRDVIPNQFIVPNDVARRDMTAGTNSAGGYTVQTDVGGLIPLLRNKMVTARAGVQTLTGLVGNVSLPKQTAAATAYWTTETGAATEGNQTLGQVSLTPHRLAAFTDISKQLIAQSTLDAEGFVRNDLASILALAMDKAVIEGSGSSNQPTGVLNTSGVGSVTFGGAPTWANIVLFETTTNTANGDIGSMNWITTPGVLGKWKTTVKVSGYPVFLCEENMANGYPVLSTNQVSSNKVLYGNWSSAALAMWGGVSILVDPYSQATSGLIRLVADAYVDVGVRQAGAFTVSSDSGAQ